MMMNNLTDVTILLDRSGSMVTIADDTIGGYNSFMESLRNKHCNVSLYQFDNEIECLYVARRALLVPPLTHATFCPRASTALLQAVCEVVDMTGARLRALPEYERPAHVLFAIITDGMENASPHRYTYESMSAKIEHQRNKYNWNVLYLGANQDAIKVAARMGIERGSSLTYAANGIGTRSAFYSAGKYATNVASGMSGVSFDAEDLELQAKAGVNDAGSA